MSQSIPFDVKLNDAAKARKSAEVAKSRIVQYHGGPILSSPIGVHVIWYGKWETTDQAIVREFLASFTATSVRAAAAASQKVQKPTRKGGRKLLAPQPSTSDKELPEEKPSAAADVPTVREWWATTRQYADKQGRNTSSELLHQGEHTDDTMSMGPSLTREATKKVVLAALQENGGTLPTDASAIYLVLSAPDVKQEDFCTTICGFHDFTGNREEPPSSAAAGGGGTKSEAATETLSSSAELVYAWVGNPTKQCPGFCGFPYAAPPYLPRQFATILKPPSGRLGIDALIGTVSHELSESATDPHIDAWYAGAAGYPQEIADLCLGVFGPNSYSGNPGFVHTTAEGGAYNVIGALGRPFLLPHLWDANMAACSEGQTF